jgi:molecular chaperone GrpE
MNDKPDEPAHQGGSEQVEYSAGAKTEQAEANQALLQTIAELKAANADLRDKHLRTIAEMENFRRRAEKEKSDGMKYAVTDFARDIVSIGDNLRRAIEAVQKEPLDENPALKTLLDGVEVTERELIKIFERHGVTRFDPLGEKFDPHVHEAMIKVDVPSVPAETVVQVLQAGYKINDRILRPAAVIVAKGGSGVQADRKTAGPDDGGGATDSPNGEGNSEGEHGGLQPAVAQEHDPDLVRDPTGAPRGGQSSGKKERPGAEKRASSVTQPVTENSGSVKKDDLISSFGKRLENGN